MKFKNLIILTISALFASKSFAGDLGAEMRGVISEKVSEYVGSLVPGEGITEFSFEIEEESSPSYSLLAVRDINKTEHSNLFTQFSFHNREVGGDNRVISNLGMGKRFLNSDKSMMFGANSFLDFSLDEKHARASIGLEAKAEILEFVYNQYVNLTDNKLSSLLYF